MAVIFSIAASQILLAAALVTLLFSETEVRLPPLRLPLALFILATLASLAFSADPAAGVPQVRKFFVWFILLVVYSTFRQTAHLRRLVLCWGGAGALVAARSLVQFGEKYREARFAGYDFYEYYLGERISGFMSHWMTFGGQVMVVSLLLAAFLFFSPSARRKNLWYALLCLLMLALSLLFGFTRSIWLGAAAAGLYLLAAWRPRLLWLAPLLAVAGAWLAPPAVRSRVVSVIQPRGTVDSNQHRIVCWRTGWEMIKAHPWLGVGPEQVRVQFDRWVPPDIPRPLPTGWYGHLHSIYVHYAAERGVPAMLILVWLLVKMLLDFLGALRRLPRGPCEERFLLHGAVAVVIAIMVSGALELNLGDSEVLTLFLAVAACGYAAWDRAAPQSAPAPAPPLP